MRSAESLVAWIGLRLTLLVLTVGTIGCDRVTKHLAATALAGASSRSFLADTVRLEYAENTGGFLSLGAALPDALRTGLFTFGTGFLLLVMIGIAIHQRPHHVWSIVGITLFLAGGLSNWFDRLASGRVIDFLNVGFGPLRTGIFNVADVAIMAGAALMLLAMGTADPPPAAE